MPGRSSLVSAPVITIVMTLVLSFGALAWQRLDPDGFSRFTGAEGRPTSTVTNGVRLATPTLAVPHDSSYRFIATQPTSGEPVAFDPCRPIHYVVRPSRSLPAGDRLIDDALARITAASGLTFVDDGATDEAPTQDRANYQPDRYGDRWAPVLIAWSGAEELPRLAGEVIGLTSSQPVRAEGDRLALVSGQIALDADQLADVVRFNGGRAVAVATITHELGHLVGLDHVDDPRQLMYPQARPLVSTFGNGDLTGLAALGKGACFSDL